MNFKECQRQLRLLPQTYKKDALGRVKITIDKTHASPELLWKLERFNASDEQLINIMENRI